VILEDILTVLKQDSELSALLQATAENSKIFAYNADIVELPCITYVFTPVSDNKIIRTDRLEINSISQSFSEALAIDAQIRELMLTFADGQFNNRILNIEINGGGSMENMETNTYHYTVYFIIDSKH